MNGAEEAVIVVLASAGVASGIGDGVHTAQSIIGATDAVGAIERHLTTQRGAAADAAA